jgi:cytochrome c-type biogenesis protein CcmH
LIAFVLIAAAMVIAAVAIVLVPLLIRRSRQGIARDASNVAILRDQLAELDADLASGAMPREHYEEARRELEERVLEDSKAAAEAGAPSQSAAWTAAIVAGAMPIAALLLYVGLGNHDAFAPVAVRAQPEGAQHEITPQQVEAMAAKLAAKLEKEPDNAEGWVMLARTYYAINRHADAARAFDKAVALVPNDAGLLADYADALGAAQGGLRGKSLELVERALKADPTQWKALALAGTAAFERKDYQQAIVYWERMKATVPPDSPIAKSIDSSIAEAREMGGIKADAPVAAAPTIPAAAGAKGAPTTPARAATPASAARAAIAGTVSLAPALAGKAAPTDTVYIFARAAEGPKMPLAIVKRQVKDLPAAFTLDDSMAMSPDFALSNYPSIVVGARVSKSGAAAPQSGDLEGFSPAVGVGTAGLSVVIDRTLP